MGAAMSDRNRSLPRNEVSDTALAEWVDQIADRFETAWRSNSSPRVEDLVADTPEPGGIGSRLPEGFGRLPEGVPRTDELTIMVVRRTG